MIIKARQIPVTSVVILFLMLALTGCEQQELKVANVIIAADELILNPTEGKWYYNNQPFNGYGVVLYDNGSRAEQTGYYQGKKEGIARKWYKDGSIKKESFYKKNRLHGSIKGWWSNGTQSMESYYENGVLNGVQKRWYPNGQLSRKTHRMMGKEEGLQQAWLQNGKIYVNYEAKNGRVFGLKKSVLCYELENEVVQN